MWAHPKRAPLAVSRLADGLERERRPFVAAANDQTQRPVRARFRERGARRLPADDRLLVHLQEDIA